MSGSEVDINGALFAPDEMGVGIEEVRLTGNSLVTRVVRFTYNSMIFRELIVNVIYTREGLGCGAEGSG